MHYLHAHILQTPLGAVWIYHPNDPSNTGTQSAKLPTVPNDVPYICDIRSELATEIEPLFSEQRMHFGLKLA